MNDAPFRAHGSGVLGQWSHQIELQFEGGIGLAFGERGMHRACDRVIEQRRGEAAVPSADRVVMTKLRRAFKYGAPLIRRDQPEAEGVRDRRLWQSALDDRTEETQSVVGQHHVYV